MLFFTGCGGSSSGGSTGASTTLSGIAAAGAPISGIIKVKGANNETVTVTIDSDGSFSVNVSALTAPYILFAEGTVNNTSVKYFSCAVATGSVNVSQVTDFIVRKVLRGQDPQTAYDSWQNHAETGQTDIDATTQKAMIQLAPLVDAAGVDHNFNPMRTSFETGSTTGFDKVLDGVTITYVDSIATVTNNYTEEHFDDDVTSDDDDSNCLPDDNTSEVMQDEKDIDAIFQALTNLYATSRPNQAQLTDFFDTYAADDFFRCGLNATGTVSNWINDDPPPIGMKLHWVNVRQLTEEELAGTSYSDGYLGRLYFTAPGDSASFPSYAVYDGNKWLWYGDQHWADYDVEPYENMEINSDGTVDFRTGFAFYVQDAQNYAYSSGIRSAIVTGPGLGDGVVLAPGSNGVFELRDGGYYFYFIDDDAVISTIGDNADYTITLCTEEPAAVSAISDCSGEDSTTITVPKPPLLNSEFEGMGGSYFPTLTRPASHALEDAHTGGVLDFAWTNPNNMTVHKADLIWEDAGAQQVDFDTEALDAVTSARIDTSHEPSAPQWALLHLYGYDIFGREFALDWYFFSQP